MEVVNGKMEGNKWAIMEGNLIKAAEDLRLPRRTITSNIQFVVAWCKSRY